MQKIKFLDLNYQTKIVEKNIFSRWNKLITESNFILGEVLEEFEVEFSNYCNSRYSIGVGNGGDAIELLIRSLNLEKKSRIFIPSNTFFATASAISRSGFEIVFVDIDLESGLISLEKLLNHKLKKTDCILPVHLFGSMVDVKTIKANLFTSVKMIEDSAQAHGATFKQDRPGKYSLGATYSFYPGKNLGGFGDGGIITTNSKIIAEKLKKLRNYGSIKKYKHDLIGFNSRLDPIQAIVLSEKLKYLDTWNQQRKNNFLTYIKNLENIPQVKFLNNGDISGSVFHLTVARVKKRNELVKFLKNNNIDTIIHYPIPLHKTKAYINHPIKKNELKNSEILSKEIISLPNYPGMSMNQINYVCEKIVKFYK
jgi:dTDP-4-amino-4,6-dideoxygalactose transaminase